MGEEHPTEGFHVWCQFPQKGDYVRLQRHQRKALFSLLESFCHPSKDNGQATSWGFSVNSSANPTMSRAGGIKKCL